MRLSFNKQIRIVQTTLRSYEQFSMTLNLKQLSSPFKKSIIN